MVLDRGAFVISLDFELHWGVRDLYRANNSYALRIINERKVIPYILNLFDKYEVSATWAIVGMMLARNRKELQDFSPIIRPKYINSELDPYEEELGQGEWDDPLHYAYELIQLISKQKGQEIATHTFSHYYCLEAGQNRQSFEADLDSALNLAQKFDIQIQTIVFPRNQHNPNYNDIIRARGIKCYRGTENHFAYKVEKTGHRLPHKRIYRLLDSYVNISGLHLYSLKDVLDAESGLCNVKSSRYLRPIGGRSSALFNLTLKRIMEAMEEAAKSKKIFHLWTHPQDFGYSPEVNLQAFKIILEHYEDLKMRYGFQSLNMLEAAEMAQDELLPV